MKKKQKKISRISSSDALRANLRRRKQKKEHTKSQEDHQKNTKTADNNSFKE